MDLVIALVALITLAAVYAVVIWIAKPAAERPGGRTRVRFGKFGRLI
jgi:hypothetical protein